MSNAILSLSGWTQPTDAIASVLGAHVSTFDYSEHATPEAAIDALQSHGETKHVVAWSMGGLFAVRAIEAGALNPEKLTLVAPPYRFVNGDGFEAGMDPQTFVMFRDNYTNDASRTKTRFHGLVAKGDARMREVVPLLGHHEHVENVSRWLPWLEDLGAYNHASSAHAHLPDTQLIQGENDAIVPKGQAAAWAQHYPSIKVHFWENVGHAPHFHDKARFLAQVKAHHGEIV